MLTFIEFCAGLGGMRIAMERLGHKCLGYCESEPPNIELYPMIHTTEDLWFSNDIQIVKPENVPEVDCYCISCPSFVCSNFLTIVEARKPKFIIMEGDSAHYCGSKLESLGYYFEIEGATIGWKWEYAIAQRDTKINILPIGIDHYMNSDAWKEKDFPPEKLEILKKTRYFEGEDDEESDTSFIIRLSQIKAIVEIAKKLDS